MFPDGFVVFRACPISFVSEDVKMPLRKVQVFWGLVILQYLFKSFGKCFILGTVADKSIVLLCI